jgi:hypothetical protein
VAGRQPRLIHAIGARCGRLADTSQSGSRLLAQSSALIWSQLTLDAVQPEGPGTISGFWSTTTSERQWSMYASTT